MDIKLNTSLAANLFSFKPPSGIDVIDETKH
jgi:outer membrane lipoprotein-sorting protein